MPQLTITGDQFAHDPSTLIREGDKYFYFSTGGGIAARMSPDKLAWVDLPRVFATPPAWTTEVVPGFKQHFWAPDVALFNGQYHLYYSVSTFGKRTSAIGLVTTKSLDPTNPGYGFTDHGPVIKSTEESAYNAIDPAIFIDQDRSVWMSFGSFWGGIYLIELNPRTGLAKYPHKPALHLAHKEEIEAPYITRRGNWYYLFVNWGFCCRGLKATYNIRVGRSRSVTGPYIDRDNEPLTTGGGTLFLDTEDHRIGPGHAGIYVEGKNEYFSYHYYHSLFEGKSHYALCDLYWTPDGWPTLTPPA